MSATVTLTTTKSAVAPPSNGNNNNMFHYGSPQRKFPLKAAVDVEFRDVFYNVTVWSIQEPIPKKKPILHGVSGHFKAGQLTAIMGPSGAGKSSLLDVLAGYRIRGTTGSIMLDGKRRSPATKQHLSKLSCYIQQDDRLRMGLTSLEAMNVVAQLKLGPSVPEAQKKKQIQDLLSSLGLLECQNTRTKLLSGGQKKRLSIALELVANPPVIFLDEPTTGLDSSSCSQCVSLLKLLAQEGRTIVCTIHQPSALIFEMFDHLYALAEGRCVYQGTVPDLLPFLADKGLHCPPYHNPADFLMDVSAGEDGADIEVLAKAAAAKFPVSRSISEAEGIEQQEVTKSSGDKDQAVARTKKVLGSLQRPSLGKQFLLLYKRNLLLLRREYNSLLVRLAAHLIIALIFGYLYRDVGIGADTIFANFVFCYGSVMFVQYTGMMAVILSFPLEMRTLRREHFNRWYSLGPYYFALILVEVPVQIVASMIYLTIGYLLTGQPVETDKMVVFFAFGIMSTLSSQAVGLVVGAVMPTKIAVFIGPTILVSLSMFGFNMFKRDIPKHYMWLYHLSYFRAALHGICYVLLGPGRAELPCPKELLYCHYKYPAKFLNDVDIIDIDVPANLAMVSGTALLMYCLTALAVWLRLNKR